VFAVEPVFVDAVEVEPIFQGGDLLPDCDWLGEFPMCLSGVRLDKCCC
jgi:hypothetical protein